MFKKILAGVALVMLTFGVSAGNVIIQNQYIKAGVNESTGTLGSGGNTSPGLLYDNLGSSTWNTAYDYLTPGSPYEGWAVRIDDATGARLKLYGNNNAGFQMDGNTTVAGAWVGSTSASSVVWAGSATEFDIRHTYSLPSGQKYIDISTRIEAKAAIAKLYFGRYIDPDAVAAPGDSSATDNVRGYGIIPKTNVVFSEATVSRYALGLYSAKPSGVNTSIQGWTSDPKNYYDNVGGYDVGNGDDTIGIAFYNSNLAIGDIVTYNYAYIFGPSAFASMSYAIDGGAGGGTAGTSGFGTLTDVGSATDAASAPTTPPAPTITSTSTTTVPVSTTNVVNTSLPVITASLAHHDASRTGGVQTIARETTTNVTTPMTRTVTTLERTTTTYSDSSVVVTDSAPTSTSTLWNDVVTSVANDSFSGRADQAEQFDIINAGLYRTLNRQSGRQGVADEYGRLAINYTGSKFNGQNGYKASTSIVGLSYETDVNRDLIVGFQLNRISGKLDGVDTNNASLSGTHVGLYADYTFEGFTIQNDLARANIDTQYNRTIGPFTNGYQGNATTTWFSSKVYTPSMEGFRPFVGATLLKNDTPTQTESGSIQSAQTVVGSNTTKTISEVGLAYDAEVMGGNMNIEVAKASNDVREAILSLSKKDGNAIYGVSLGKMWINDTSTTMVGVNVKVSF